MLDIRSKLLTALVVLVGLGACASVRAASIYEPNNSPSKAYGLLAGTLMVTDDLNGNVARPATILGEYGPAYGAPVVAPLQTSSSAPGVGNGYGSQLLGVPLYTNGSAYFSVTGAPDFGFAGAHTQFGKYSTTFDVYNPAHELVKTHTELEWVTPGMIDYVWLDPDLSLADWTGYTVDVTVNNVVGPGSGDSLDYFLFSGLQPFIPFTAQLTDVEFDALIGLYDSGNSLVTLGTLVGGVPTLTGIADSMGRVKIGVTGLGDNAFQGAHAQTGIFTLVIVPVPEPDGGLMLVVGTALWCLMRKCRRGRRRRPLSA